MRLRHLVDMSIKSKLKWICMLVCGVAVLVTAGVTVGLDYRSFKQYLVLSATTHADVVGLNSAATLTFEDDREAEQTLSLLKVAAEIDAAALYTRDGALLAVYTRENRPFEFPKTAQAEGHSFIDDGLDIWREVRIDGQTLGTIYVRANNTLLDGRISNHAMIIPGIVVLACVLAYLLVGRLQGLVTRPIVRLTEASRSISSQRNFSIRVEKESQDEVGQLIDCFNEMLGQIQDRDAQLNAHREQLEEEVKIRTAELIAANADLKAAKDRAEEASRAKSAFLANMSHEIRTPMTAILGYSDLMLSANQDVSDRVNSLQVVRRNAQHLMQLIGDVLDVSKIEAERMTVESIQTDLPALIGDVLSMLRPRAVARGLTLEAQFDGPIPTTIRTDPLRLKQILMNLIGNAIKFTLQGGVTLRVHAQRDPGSSRITFEVRDTGIGLSEQQIGKLFQPFVQADGSMTRQFGGTGLGLVISKRLAKLMSGDITVRSRPGEGSVFTIWIDGGPLDGVRMIGQLTESMLHGEEPREAPAAPTISANILLAEDGFDNQQLLLTYLTSAGATVTLAENGQAALEKVQAERFDLILLDMQMPVMDGYTAAAEMRLRGIRLPIIALTAHAMSGDRERCLAAGCTDYLTKPVDQILLLQTIGRHLERAHGVRNGERAAHAPAAAVQPMGVPAMKKMDAPVMSALVRATQGFIARLPQRVLTIREAIEKNDMPTIITATHQLKGAAAGYGFPRVGDLAAKIETAARVGSTLANLTPALEGLIEEIRNVPGYDISLETKAA